MPILRACALVWLAVSAVLAGCADNRVRPTAPPLASDGPPLRLPGQGFEHLAWFQPGRAGGGRLLHVYLEGDGSPWRGGRVPAADPTARNPVARRLMALDPAPSLYLGRPCYHGLATAPGCGPALWTGGRYSEPVVASMAAALATFAAQQDLVLIGYSGGGVLAWLLAERLPRVRALITVAANLDPAAWARYHHYLPLTESLNPAHRPPLPPSIVQLHVQGSRDGNVPPTLATPVIAAAAGPARLLTLPVDHACCWERHWPAVLQTLEPLLGEASAGPTMLRRPLAGS